MQADFIFTSEAVTRGHPDKLCDAISDAVLGHYLRQDPLARIVAECAASTGILFVSVKHASSATVDVANTARHVIDQVGYRDGPFNARSCTVMSSMIEDPQGPAFDERILDDTELDRVTARDQATVTGYACDHTPCLMPLPIWLANRVVRALDEARQSGELPELAPDGKVQVGVEFRGGRPYRIHAITLVVAQRRADAPSPEQLDEGVRELVLTRAFAEEPIAPDAATSIAINPEGAVVGGGPQLHAGLTGHKGAADTYGGFARQSVSGLSGKDPSRIDRIGAYAARHAAMHVVAARLAGHCELQLSYSLGHASPVSIQVETFGTGRVPDDEIARRVQRVFDFRPGAIVRGLRLRDLPAQDPLGFFPNLSAYGHVGRPELGLPWEHLDRVEAIR